MDSELNFAIILSCGLVPEKSVGFKNTNDRSIAQASNRLAAGAGEPLLISAKGR